MIRRLLMPKMYVKDVYSIDYEALYKTGKRLVIFDIDNTLKSYEDKIPSDFNIDLFKNLQKIGFKLCLLSNGRKSRVERFNRGLRLNAKYLALKPLPFNLLSLLKEEEVKSKDAVIIGDQIFTDILLGNALRLTTILVNPIKPKTTLLEKFKRNLEKKLLKMYNITQCIK